MSAMQEWEEASRVAADALDALGPRIRFVEGCSASKAHAIIEAFDAAVVALARLISLNCLQLTLEGSGIEHYPEAYPDPDDAGIAGPAIFIPRQYIPQPPATPDVE